MFAMVACVSTRSTEMIGPNAIRVSWRKHLRAPLIIDAEVVCLDGKGAPNFDAPHSRVSDAKAGALAFDLLLAGDDIGRHPLRSPTCNGWHVLEVTNL